MNVQLLLTALHAVRGIGRGFGRALYMGALLGVMLGTSVGVAAEDPANATMAYEVEGEQNRTLVAGEYEVEVMNGPAQAEPSSPYGRTITEHSERVDQPVQQATEPLVPDEVDAAGERVAYRTVDAVFGWVADVGSVTATAAYHAPPWVPVQAVGGLAGLLIPVSMLNRVRRQRREMLEEVSDA